MKCYGCKKEFVESDMRYICKCRDNTGVCKFCDIKECKIPDGHMLSKNHNLTPEYSDLMDRIGIECGKDWYGAYFKDNDIIIQYYSIPKRILYNIIPYSLYWLFKKEKRFTWVDKVCSCC